MIYAGQEHLAITKPDLFDINKVEWDQYKDISPFITVMHELTSGDLFTKGIHSVSKCEVEGVFVGEYKLNEHVVGIFNVGLKQGEISIDVEDGTYINIIYDEEVYVEDGMIKLSKKPVMFYV